MINPKLRQLLIRLHESEGIGWKTIDKLNQLGLRNPQKLKERLTDAMTKEMNLQARQVKQIHKCLDAYIMGNESVSTAQGIQVLTIWDQLYPSLLKQIHEAPWVLYGQGNIDALKYPCIAVVGTRNPTYYGKKVAFKLAYDLAEQGFCIVSGLARGIDAAAHRGAIEAGGPTIAVMGTGLDRVYPKEHDDLLEQVIKNGLALTEYPAGTPSSAGMFPRRNRIIAGLAQGTLVVEAAKRSGSLITAHIAMDESRDVFAVPGPITSPQSTGTLELIKDGAKLVMQSQDISEEYDSVMNWNGTEIINDTDRELELSPDERKVVSFLSSEPVSIDDLIQEMKCSFGHLHSVLLSLLMKNKIEQLPGSMYVTK